MGSYLYQFYYKTIYSDFKNANLSFISSVESRHENDMEILNNIIIQIGLQGNNVEFLLKDAPLKSVALKEQLHRYLSVSQFFNQIFFYNREDQYLYNDRTSVDINLFVNEGIVLEKTSRDEFYGLLQSTKNEWVVLSEQNIEGYLAKKLTAITPKAVIYLKAVAPKNTSMMLFAVGDAYYEELLQQPEQELRQTLIIHNGNRIVSEGTLPLEEEVILQQIGAMKESQSTIRVNNQKYLVSKITGDSGLEYCTIQSTKIFQNKIVAEQWSILFIIFLCSIPTGIIMVLLSKRIIKKVRDINSLLSKEEESGYDLEKIEHGIRILVESNREVNRESLALRRTRFISNFIRNEYLDRASIISAAKEVELKADSILFAVALMGDRGNSNENKAHEMMLMAMEERFTEDGYGIHLINKNQSLFVVFGNHEESMKSLFQHFFLIGKEYCEDFVMSTSGLHSDFSEASKAYLEADAAFDNRFLMDNNKIIDFADVAGREHVALIQDVYVHQLKNAIQYEDEEGVKEVIHDICNSLKTQQQTLFTFRILYNDIIHMMISEWNRNRPSFDHIYNVFTLSQCLTLDDFNDVLCEVATKLMSHRISVKTKDKKKDMVTEAIRYMQQNFQSPELNMGALAEYLSVSGVTLAVEFKNVMSMSPSDYLAITRMEHAKKLLRETDLRIKEISLQVGYEDPHVFLRRFKKYVGKTPGQYRTD